MSEPGVRGTAATILTVLVVAGPPCTGKSTLARSIAERRRFVHLEMDRLRARLLPDAGNAKSARTVAYRAMHAFAEVLLGLGHSVILDATYGPADHRADVEALVTRTGAALFLVQCRAPADLAAVRFGGRATDHPANDLTAVKVEALARAYPYHADGLVLDTSDALDSAREAVEHYLELEVSLDSGSGWSRAAIGRWT